MLDARTHYGQGKCGICRSAAIHARSPRGIRRFKKERADVAAGLAVSHPDVSALSLAMAFSHLLQMRPRMSYEAVLWRSTQTMYQLYGLPIGAIIETGAWISALALLYLVRKHSPAFRWTVLGLFVRANRLVDICRPCEQGNRGLDLAVHAPELERGPLSMGERSCCPGHSADCRFCRARLVDPWWKISPKTTYLTEKLIVDVPVEHCCIRAWRGR